MWRLAKASVVLALTCLCPLMVTPVAYASEWELTDWELGGYIASEIRLFPSAAAFSEQNSESISPAVTLQPEFRIETTSGDDQFVAIPYLKYDRHDDNRSHRDIRELYWRHQEERWSLLVGLNKVFWGVTEARHVVDVINQTDLVESPFAEDKFGQGMINFRYFASSGTFDGFLLLGFRDRSFADDDARLRGSLPIDSKNPVFTSSDRRAHPDWALRWAKAIGDWDVGLAHFHGTGREPRLLTGLQNNGAGHLVPYYDIIDQTSLDLQYTFDNWIWKLETFTRRGQDDRFLALAGGFEYTFFDVAGHGIDLGLLAEYLYDNRTAAAPPTRFDDDIFVGFRLALNDAAGTMMTGGAIIDRHTDAMSFNIEAGWRFDDHWRLDVEALVFHQIPTRATLFGVRRDDYLQLQLSRFF
jgi:hypothetical protein